MGTNDLRPGQYKRIGRIAENNPNRAERVAARMTTRSERKDRGKEIADQYSTSSEKTKKLARQLSQLNTNQERKKSYFSRPDTPLAETPEPKKYQ